MNTIITRHNGLVEWLGREGIQGNVIAHATPADVAGRVVYGVLPLNLAALAKEVWVVDLPNLPAELRGKEITPEQMDEAGAKLTGYVVKTIAPE